MFSRYCSRYGAAVLALLVVAVVAPAANAQSPSLPPSSAQEAVRVGSGWLIQEAHALRLVDADGTERAALPVRGAHLDARADVTQVFGVTLDADTQRVVMVDVDRARMQWRVREPLPLTHVAVETLCLFRDAQRNDQLIVIGTDGQSEQWILSEPQPRLLRRLALPARVEHCRVDDASETLFVSEPDIGVWAYDLRGETIPARVPVLLRKPYGSLAADAGVLAVIPGGVAVAEATGRSIHAVQPHNGGWRVQATLRPAQVGEIDALLVHASAGRVEFSYRHDKASDWQRQSLSWRTPAAEVKTLLPIVTARAQTESVARLGDAADDPAIWIHPTDARRSRVLGTNKKQGLLIYDLAGQQLRLLDVGRLNNVDLRQRVTLGEEVFDLAVATHRDDLSLVVFAIDAEGEVAEVHRIPTELANLYGLCLYAPPSGGLQVIANDKDGSFLQFALQREAGSWRNVLLRRFSLQSQPEGCVADDARQRLFVGEEKRGVWSLAADGAQAAVPQLILPVGDLLQADVEGMAIHHGATPYLVVSSQGNSSYVVLDALPPFHTRGAFRVGLDAARGIDGSSDTDGLDVVSTDLGAPFAAGLLVVQDGHKRMPDGAQNFKYVAWEDVARALGLP